MDTNDRDRLVNQYVAEKIQGRELSKIRQEMLQNGLPQLEVNTLIRLIDEKVLQHELDKTRAKINKQILYLGCVIIAIGLVLFLLSRSKVFIIKRDLVISSLLLITGTTMVIYGLIFSSKPRRHKPKTFF